MKIVKELPAALLVSLISLKFPFVTDCILQFIPISICKRVNQEFLLMPMVSGKLGNLTFWGLMGRGGGQPESLKGAILEKLRGIKYKGSIYSNESVSEPMYNDH